MGVVLLALVGTACGGSASPDSDGWYSLGSAGDIRIHADDLGAGCRLIGGDYGEFTLDPLDRHRPDPGETQCDALVEFDGFDIVLSGDDGGVHEAYDDVGLQPLLVEPGAMYMSFRDITSPGGFKLTVVFEDGGIEEERALNVQAIDPR